MKRLSLFISIFLLRGIWGMDAAFAGKPVSAKIGIQLLSGDIIKRARTHDRLKKNDRLRVYVEPAFDAYVYVIYKGQDATTLLSPGEEALVKKGRRLTLPSAKEYYETDGLSAIESFTIICSPREIAEITAFFENEEKSGTDWLRIERNLMKQSKIDLHDKTEKPFAIAGNVRAPGDEEKLIEDFKIYTGKGMVVQQFKFRVKK